MGDTEQTSIDGGGFAPHQFRISQLLWAIPVVAVAALAVAHQYRDLPEAQLLPVLLQVGIGASIAALTAMMMFAYRALVARGGGALLLAAGFDPSTLENAASFAQWLWYRLQIFGISSLLALCILSNPVDVVKMAARGNSSETFNFLTIVVMPGALTFALVLNLWRQGRRSLEVRRGGLVVRGVRFVAWSQLRAIEIDDTKGKLQIIPRDDSHRSRFRRLALPEHRLLNSYPLLLYDRAVGDRLRAVTTELIAEASRGSIE